jgi:putative DNA primase/helicase
VTLRLVDGPPPDDPDDPGPAADEPREAEDDTRDLVIVRKGDLDKTEQAATAALLKAEGVYNRGGILSRIVPRDDGYPLVVPLSPPSLASILCGLARFTKQNRVGKKTVLSPVDPPPLTISAIHSAGQWPVPYLTAIQATPPIRPDGSVYGAPGYDPETRIYYHAGEEEEIHPAELDQRGAAAAREKLLGLVADYRWERDRDADAWLSGLLSPLVRAWTGPVPMLVITSTTPGSGKSLLTDLIGRIIGMPSPARMRWTTDDEEAGKRILALAIAGYPVVVIDNVPNGTVLGGAALDMALTAHRIMDRVLRESRIVDIAVGACWYATGNNLRVLGDTARRTIICSLDPRCERPEDRTDFAVEDLREYTTSHHRELLEAAIGIVSGYLRAGCPGAPSPVGSFEAWSRVVRGSIIWAGGADVAEAIGSRKETSDPDAEVHRLLLESWYSALPRGATASQALIRCTEHDDDPSGAQMLSEAIGEICPGRSGAALGTARQLGARLRELEGRIRSVGGRELRLVRADVRGPAAWIVEDMSQVREPGAEG